MRISDWSSDVCSSDLGGGDMIHTVSFERSTYADVPQRFEAGTPNIAGVVRLDAAIRYVLAIGLEAIAAHEHFLLELGTQELLSLPGVRLIGTAAHKAGILSFVVDRSEEHTSELQSLMRISYA